MSTELEPLAVSGQLASRRARRRRPDPTAVATHAISMRELGKLTADQVARIDHPVPVTSNGQPIAWLVPMTPGERRRAELIAAGELRPRRREELSAWTPLPPITDGPSLSEILADLRASERT